MVLPIFKKERSSTSICIVKKFSQISMYFIPWIAVSPKVLQVTVDCSLLLKDCNFSGLSHSGLCVWVCPLSHSGFLVGMSCIYVSRFTCVHTKTMRGNFERPGEFWDLGLSLKYVSRNFNQFEKSHSFWNMHAELRQLELYQNVSLTMTSIVRLCGLSISIFGSEQ